MCSRIRFVASSAMARAVMSSGTFIQRRDSVLYRNCTYEWIHIRVAVTKTTEAKTRLRWCPECTAADCGTDETESDNNPAATSSATITIKQHHLLLFLVL